MQGKLRALCLVYIGLVVPSFTLAKDSCPLSLGQLPRQKKERARSPLELYLRDIKRFPLLDKAETTQLFIEIEALEKKIIQRLYQTTEGLQILKRGLDTQGNPSTVRSAHYRRQPNTVCDAPSALPEKASKPKKEAHHLEWVSFIENIHKQIEQALESGNLKPIQKALSKIKFNRSFFEKYIFPEILKALREHQKYRILGGSFLDFEAEDFLLIETLLEKRNEIANANIRLAINIAKKYQRNGFKLPHLISVANVKLMHAIDTFDYRLGFALSTWVSKLIKRELTITIQAGQSVVETPSYLPTAILDYERFRMSFYQEHLRPPTDEEIKKALDIKNTALQNIRAGIAASTTGQQTKTNTTTDEEFDVIKSLAAKQEANPLILQAIKDFLYDPQHFIETETLILELYFGFKGEEKMTLMQIGEETGLSKERVRQIKEASLKKMRELLEAHFFK